MKDCNQCGKCCIKYGGGDLNVTKQEIEHWEINHPDIFEYVKDNEIWFNPLSGERLERCPFLHIDANAKAKNNTKAPTKYTCSIYPYRPEDCRLYPSLVSEMIRDECEMIETSDLVDTTRSQIRLDILMDR